MQRFLNPNPDQNKLASAEFEIAKVPWDEDSDSDSDESDAADEGDEVAKLIM